MMVDDFHDPTKPNQDCHSVPAPCSSKKWYQSRLLWVNGIALIASLAQAKWGVVMDPALQGVILTFANIILRLLTNSGIEGVEK